MRLGYWAGRYLLARAVLTARMLRWRAQWTVNVGHRLAWRHWDEVRQERALLATTRGTLPEVEDYAAAFAPVLDELEPDIIHAHHPLVLGTAVRAARRRRAAGHRCFVVYDAREDFLGIPKQEQGHWRRHSALVREEARHIRSADAVITVSEPITRTLAERYDLARRPGAGAERAGGRRADPAGQRGRPDRARSAPGCPRTCHCWSTAARSAGPGGSR